MLQPTQAVGQGNHATTTCGTRCCLRPKYGLGQAAAFAAEHEATIRSQAEPGRPAETAARIARQENADAISIDTGARTTWKSSCSAASPPAWSGSRPARWWWCADPPTAAFHEISAFSGRLIGFP
jgi:hypothetical protein